MATRKATSTATRQPAKTAAAKKPTSSSKPAEKKPAGSKPAKAASANSPAAKPAPKKPAAKKSPAKPAAKAAHTSSPADYTNPELREKIKAEVTAGIKGGRAGQWSARKAQLVAHEYEAQGGGYKHPRNTTQNSLKDWGDEHWHTADGKPAIEGAETHRYLPDDAWKKLSPGQKKATDQKKVAGSRTGKQFVPNTPAAATARKRATKDPG